MLIHVNGIENCEWQGGGKGWWANGAAFGMGLGVFLLTLAPHKAVRALLTLTLTHREPSICCQMSKAQPRS